MIFDCFCYNGESSLLNIRIAELRTFLPPIQHIAVQSNHTFSGKPKSFFMDFHENLYHELMVRSPSDITWDNERELRNHILTCLKKQNPDDNDIIIISDVDEIPRKEAILKFKPEMGVAFLDMMKFGFFLNLKEADHWTPPKIMSWSHLKNGTPEEIRNAGAPNTIDHGGWHFSWCGGIDEVMRKFASFSHQESEVQKHANREELIRKMAVGESLWGQDKWRPVPITELPQYVQNHQEELKHLIFHGNS